MTDPDETTPRPRVICLCGPRRFADELRAAWIKLAMAGHTVVGTPDLDVSAGPEADAVVAAHLRLIELADEVYVATGPDGYIGEGTAAEIAHACRHGKSVTFSPGADLGLFADLLGAEAVTGRG